LFFEFVIKIELKPILARKFTKTLIPKRTKMIHIGTISNEPSELNDINSRKTIMSTYGSVLVSYGTEIACLIPYESYGMREYFRIVPSCDSFMNCFIEIFFERQYYKVS